ncbi:TPA: hypothetical protein QDC06_000203 [Burkholderia cepacia]|nr:hypothetical protein [Burkholderia cepacia]
MIEFWSAVSQEEWYWPVSMSDEELHFSALGWPGCEPIRGYHAGPKSCITIWHHDEIKTFEIHWPTVMKFSESNTQEVRDYPIQWEY